MKGMLARMRCVAGAATPPGVLPVPSSAQQGSAEARAVRRSASLGETAEQIAARQELERKDQGARTAAATVEAFVKRREELARQIQLERQVLEVARGLKDDPAWASSIVDDPVMLGGIALRMPVA